MRASLSVMTTSLIGYVPHQQSLTSHIITENDMSPILLLKRKIRYSLLKLKRKRILKPPMLLPRKNEEYDIVKQLHIGATQTVISLGSICLFQQMRFMRIRRLECWQSGMLYRIEKNSKIRNYS